jgi:hypothetical protein
MKVVNLFPNTALVKMVLIGLAAVTAGWASSPLSPSNFIVSNNSADGSASTPSVFFPADTFSFDLTGGNNGSGIGGETDFLWTAATGGTVQFLWSYTSCFPVGEFDGCDSPGYDWAGYMVDLAQTQLTDTDTLGASFSADFHVNAGSVFGWYVGTFDNLGEPGTLTASSLAFTADAAATPEPASALLFLAGGLFLAAFKLCCLNPRKLNGIRRVHFRGLLVAMAACGAAPGQIQNVYQGSVVTGQLQMTATTNLSQLALAGVQGSVLAALSPGPEQPRLPAQLPPPPPKTLTHQTIIGATLARANSLAFTASIAATGFDGLTHLDQRQASSGNQFSLEPPNPAIAVSNGKILQGVNDAVRIFTTAGGPLTPPVASNRLFGLGPAIDRTQTPNVYGVYTTDMRVFFDQDTNRWFVLQRSQDEDSSGNPLNQSHIYLAVSSTADPAGDYHIYTMDTSNVGNPGCPCVDDYPAIGTDRYGFYISSNEYSLFDPTSPFFNDATILAVSKADLAAGIATPSATRFVMPYFTGYEFTVQPAATPPGASPFLASGGVEFFVSSYPVGFDNNLALWALSNTASLQSPTPNLLLTQTTIPTLAHVPPPGQVPQRSGPLTLGTSLEQIDAGFFSDSRVLSATYAGGRLYVTLASAVFDSLGNNAAGGLYVVFSPTLRGSVLSATAPIKQGYLAATGNHILRPSVSVNASGHGAIAFTLVGNDYYPSAAFVNIDLTPSTPSAIQVAAAGFLPEDGFSGYGPSDACPTCSGFGVARWGDYSTAVTDADGSIWFVSEYIPNASRTPLANWGTFVSHFQP